MKVLLRTDVEGLGQTGDLVEVARGYARNYLVPQGLAVEAGSGMAAQVEAMQRKRALQTAADKSDAEESAARLEGLVLQVTAKASEEGRLFGSVGVVEVVSALVDQFGLEVDRRQVSGDPVKDLGTHGFTVRLHPEVDLQVSVEVQAEE